MATKNNKKNVSLGKPMVAGVAYRAPAGTALPADATTALATAYECVGFLGEDGITNATDTDNTPSTTWAACRSSTRSAATPKPTSSS